MDDDIKRDVNETRIPLPLIWKSAKKINGNGYWNFLKGGGIVKNVFKILDDLIGITKEKLY